MQKQNINEIIGQTTALYIKTLIESNGKKIDEINEEFAEALKTFMTFNNYVLDRKENIVSVVAEKPKKTSVPRAKKTVAIKEENEDPENACIHVIKANGKPPRQCDGRKVENTDYCKKHGATKSKDTVGSKSQHSALELSSSNIKAFTSTARTFKASDLLKDSSSYAGSVHINHKQKIDVTMSPITGFPDVHFEKNTNFLFVMKNKNYVCVGKFNENKHQVELTKDEITLINNRDQTYEYEEIDFGKKQEKKKDFNFSDEDFENLDDSIVEEKEASFAPKKEASPTKFSFNSNKESSPFGQKSSFSNSSSKTSSPFSMTKSPLFGAGSAFGK